MLQNLIMRLLEKINWKEIILWILAALGSGLGGAALLQDTPTRDDLDNCVKEHVPMNLEERLERLEKASEEMKAKE